MEETLPAGRGGVSVSLAAREFGRHVRAAAVRAGGAAVPVHASHRQLSRSARRTPVPRPETLPGSNAALRLLEPPHLLELRLLRGFVLVPGRPAGRAQCDNRGRQQQENGHVFSEANHSRGCHAVGRCTRHAPWRECVPAFADESARKRTGLDVPSSRPPYRYIYISRRACSTRAAAEVSGKGCPPRSATGQQSSWRP